VIVAVDNLGTGDSTCPDEPVDVDIDRMAAANAAVWETVRDRLAHGSLIPGLAAVGDIPGVGVGHSLGGFVVMVQQATTECFDATAILGASMQPNQGLRDLNLADETADAAPSVGGGGVFPIGVGIEWSRAGRSLTLRPRRVASSFYRNDVPADVIEADRRDATVIPREAALDVLVDRRWPEIASAVRGPVLLAFGDPDLSPTSMPIAGIFSATDLTLVGYPSPPLPQSRHGSSVPMERHRDLAGPSVSQKVAQPRSTT